MQTWSHGQPSTQSSVQIVCISWGARVGGLWVGDPIVSSSRPGSGHGGSHLLRWVQTWSLGSAATESSVHAAGLCVCSGGFLDWLWIGLGLVGCTYFGMCANLVT